LFSNQETANSPQIHQKLNKRGGNDPIFRKTFVFKNSICFFVVFRFAAGQHSGANQKNFSRFKKQIKSSNQNNRSKQDFRKKRFTI